MDRAAPELPQTQAKPHALLALTWALTLFVVAAFTTALAHGGLGVGYWAAGVAVTALLRNARWWPWVLLAEFLVHWQGGMPVGASIAWAMLLTCQASGIAFAVSRKGRLRGEFTTIHQVLVLIVACTVITAMIAVPQGALLMAPQPRFWERWYAHALPILLLAPFLSNLPGMLRERGRLRVVELLLFIALLGVFVYFTTYGPLPWLLPTTLPQYLLVPFVVWGAVRFGYPGALLPPLFLAGLASWSGEWAAMQQNTTWLRSQTDDAGFILVATLTGLALAAFTEERRAALLQLHASRQHLQSLLQHSPNTIYFKEWTSGRYLAVNDAFGQLVGLTTENLLHRTAFDIFPPATAAEFLRNDDEVRKTLTAKQFEETVPGTHGPRTFLSVKFPLLDSAGQPFALCCNAMDITDRKQIEQTLQATEAQFRGLVEQEVAGVYIIQDGKFQFVNHRMAEIFGRTEEEMLALPQVINGVAPEDQDRVRGFIRMRESGEVKTLHFTATGIRPDGTRFRYEAHGSSYEYRGRRAVIGILQDITERMRAEAALRENESLFRHFYESAPVMMHSLTTENRISNVNAKWLAETGFRREDVLHQPLTDFFLEKSADQLTADLTGLWADGELQGQHYVMRTTAGQIDVRLEAAVSTDPNGQRRSIFVLENITRRRAAEAQQRLAARVFDNAAEGIVVTDAGARIIAVNRSFSEITGYAEDKVLGRITRIFRESAIRPETAREIREQLATSGNWQGEMLDRRANGDFYPAWLSISAVRDELGALANYVGVFMDITSRKEAEERLNFLANHDSLTQLPNRTMLNVSLRHSLAQAARLNEKLALLFIDLDRFKIINDTLGHETGDKLLQAVADRLRSSLRESDSIARLGGDEFTVILETLATEQDASITANKIIDAMERPFIIDQHEIFIGASIGIACYPNDGLSAQALLKNADVAMYRAKELGKNNYQYFSSEMNVQALEHLVMESNLRHALERNEFEVYYQPQFDLAHQRIIGVEALLRWRHPELGLVPPAKFIPIAEETGMIVALGEWVLREATREVKTWHDRGFGHIYLAVNLSARQFRQRSLALSVNHILCQTEFDPRRLELEITESMIMHNPDEAIRIMDDLNSLGALLSIDDFGTGYSSLSNLKRFPIQCLKIDRSFILGVPDDLDDVAITEAIISMAKSLKLRVIAEGVENVDQLNFLRNLRCDVVQGFLFSRPVTADALLQMLIEQQ